MSGRKEKSDVSNRDVIQSMKDNMDPQHAQLKVRHLIRPQSAQNPHTEDSAINHIPKEEAFRITRRPRTAPGTKVRSHGVSSVSPASTVDQPRVLKRSHVQPTSKSARIASPGTASAASGIPISDVSSIVSQATQSTNIILAKSAKQEDRYDPWNKQREAWIVTPSNDVVSAEDTPPQESRVPIDAWLDGPDVDSDEYDTDLEDDFPPAPEKPIDPTGKYVYQEECHKLGMVPVSYIVRHLGDRHLRMRHHYLGGTRTIPIAEALKDNTVTETVDLTDNYIEGRGARYIADMVNCNLFIVNLNLSDNFLRAEGAQAIGEMLETNTALKTLSLSGNQLTDMDCKHFVESIKTNMSLTSLDLSHNEIGENGATWLAGALAVNEGLSELDLSWNAIRQKGAIALGNAVAKNNYLEVLDLSWNGLGAHGAAGISKGLRGNTKLKVLDLSNNRFDTKSMAKFCFGLRKNYGLETIVLNMNPIGDEGLEMLLKTVAVHPNLKFLSIEEVTLSPVIYNKIVELEERKNVIIVHGGVGGYQRYTAHSSVMRLFRRFIKDSRQQLELMFRQQDKGKEGVVSLEEMKAALREAGLMLTNKQLDVLIEEGDLQTNGNINYSELLNGSLSTIHDNQRYSKSAGISRTQTSYLASTMSRHLTV